MPKAFDESEAVVVVGPILSVKMLFLPFQIQQNQPSRINLLTDPISFYLLQLS